MFSVCMIVCICAKSYESFKSNIRFFFSDYKTFFICYHMNVLCSLFQIGIMLSIYMWCRCLYEKSYEFMYITSLTFRKKKETFNSLM
jgi:hypothetical protein